MKVNLRDASKASWYQESDNAYPGNTNIQLGCLMRIADAVEKMADNYGQFVDERNNYKSMYDRAIVRENRSARRIAGLRGAITKMKRKKGGAK